jgi:hypothetical protein
MQKGERLRKLALSVEDCLSLSQRPVWHGAERWFRSKNVIDLWFYRSVEEKQRITNFARSCWLKARGGVPLWPP